MITVNEIRLTNFKNILDCKIRIGRFNVLVGSNNSGKSNFLSVIPFLNFVINGSSDIVRNSFNNGLYTSDFGIIPREIDKYDKSFEIIIGISFSNYDLEKHYEYNLHILPISTKSSRRIGSFFISKETYSSKDFSKPGPFTMIFKRVQNDVNYGERFKRKTKYEKVTNHSSVVSLLKIILEEDIGRDSYYNAVKTLDSILNSPVIYFSNSELSKIKKSRTEKLKGRTISIDLEGEIASLEKTPQWDIFRNAVRDILQIRQISIYRSELPDELEEEIYIFFDHLGSLKNIQNLSDGSLLILALIIKVLTTENELIIIEEPENSTHPKALINLMSFLRSFEDEKQFIITTHSIPIINLLDPNNVIITKVDIEGKTTLKKVEDHKKIIKELRKGYVSFSDSVFFGD